MKRLIIVYNPRSSQFLKVREEVLEPAQKMRGYMVGKYEVAPTDLNDNIDKLARILKDDDIVLAAGGDATGIIAANAVMKSGQKAALAALPYGNFNDLARTLGTNNLAEVLSEKAERVGYYPLEIWVDGKFFRYATCYVTIGMTAEAVKLYNQPGMRKKLTTKFGRHVISYTELMNWYFRNRHKKQFIPDFELNGKKQSDKTSDYAAVNGRYMARVMKGREDYLDAQIFRSVTGRLTGFWRLFKLMTVSIINRVPGKEKTRDVLRFMNPATVEIQAEGESEVFEKVEKIEVRKADKCFKAIRSLKK